MALASDALIGRDNMDVNGIYLIVVVMIVTVLLIAAILRW